MKYSSILICLVFLSGCGRSSNPNGVSEDKPGTVPSAIGTKTEAKTEPISEPKRKVFRGRSRSLSGTYDHELTVTYTVVDGELPTQINVEFESEGETLFNEEFSVDRYGRKNSTYSKTVGRGKFTIDLDEDGRSSASAEATSWAWSDGLIGGGRIDFNER